MAGENSRKSFLGAGVSGSSFSRPKMDFRKNFLSFYDIIETDMRILWTDGSASPNPGPGGYAVIENNQPVALGREDQSTNIRMEGMALIAAMKLLNGGEGVDVDAEDKKLQPVERPDGRKYIGRPPLRQWEDGSPKICTDSEFWVNVLTKWAPGWKIRGWTKRGGEIHNLELVMEAFYLYRTVQPTLCFVRGHTGVEMNELADKWANKARKGATL